MSVCALIDADGYIKAFPTEPVENCAFTLLSHSHYDQLANRIDLEFNIDSGMHEEILFYLLLSFFTGHVLGRIVKTFGKV